jgi:hypothetical protein
MSLPLILGSAPRMLVVSSMVIGLLTVGIGIPRAVRSAASFFSKSSSSFFSCCNPDSSLYLCIRSFGLLLNHGIAYSPRRDKITRRYYICWRDARNKKEQGINLALFPSEFLGWLSYMQCFLDFLHIGFEGLYSICYVKRFS